MRISTLISTGLTVLLLVSTAFSAANYPFPQSKDFSGSIKPTSVTQELMNKQVREYYDSWKKRFVKGDYLESGGTGSNSELKTVSEAHGYGMMIIALMAGHDKDAQKIFDKFVDFYKAHPSVLNPYLMQWAIPTEKRNSKKWDQYSATDGDLDIAYAFLLAHKQWGSAGRYNYQQMAWDMIGAIAAAEINWSTYKVMYGDNWKNGPDSNKHLTRPSDWMGAHFQSFAIAASASQYDWKELDKRLLSLYQTFSNKYSSNTGLITDFVINNPVEPCPKYFLDEYEDTDTYNFNACRVPWRMAMNYGHFGTGKAKEICEKMISWLKSSTNGKAKDIKIGYELDGTALNNSDDNSASFVGPFMAAATVDKDFQNFLDQGWNVLTSLDDSEAYGASLKLMSMLYITGNWWNPVDANLSNTQKKDPVVSPGGVLLDDFANYYGDDNNQTYLGAAYGQAEIGEPYEGGGYWYVASGKAKVTSKGVEIKDDNVDKIVHDKKMDFKVETEGSDEAWALIGCTFIDADNTKYYDFENLDGITITAKGKGTIRVSLSTKDINDLSSDERWGFYGYVLELTDDMKDHVIPVEYLVPADYSPAFNNGWGWENHSGYKVEQFMMKVSGKDQEVSMQIDSIVFNGLAYKKHFNFTPEIIAIDNTGSSVTKTGISLLKGKNNNPRLVYRAAKDGYGTVQMFNPKGVMVSELFNGNIKKGKHSIHIDKTRFSTGIYFVKYRFGKQIFTQKVRIN